MKDTIKEQFPQNTPEPPISDFRLFYTIVRLPEKIDNSIQNVGKPIVQIKLSRKTPTPKAKSPARKAKSPPKKKSKSPPKRKFQVRRIAIKQSPDRKQQKPSSRFSQFQRPKSRQINRFPRY